MTVVERSTEPVRQVGRAWVEALLAGPVGEPGTPLRWAIRWAEAAVTTADESLRQLQALTPGVGAFYDSYTGPLDPEAVTRAAADAGLRLSGTDMGLLAFALGAFRGATPVRTAESARPVRDEVWLADLLAVPAGDDMSPRAMARRCAEADMVGTQVAIDRLLARGDDVAAFHEAYSGPTDPDAIGQAAVAAGLDLDHLEVGLLALAIGAFRT